jgi:hypothetical protein
MAPTKKRRRRKHRGTQGGRIDTRRTARPRNRQEAKARARSQRTTKTKKVDRPPTWRGAINRALVGGAIIAVVMTLLTKQPAQGISLGLLMIAFYTPLLYLFESYMWRRRERQKMRTREQD